MELYFLKTIKNAIKHWYIPLFVGLLFVIISIVAFVAPMESFVTLAVLFALSLLLGGLSEIIFSTCNREQLDNWGWSLAFGIVTFIVGVLLLINTSLSMTTLALYIGFIILFRSISAISISLDIKRYGSKNWGYLLALGLLGAIFSFILLWNPLFAGLSIVVWVALSFLFAGLFSIYFSFQLRTLHNYSKKLSPELDERFRMLKEDIDKEWNS
ncbi:MAG: DUF308 domain-containing protein [Bacteroidales bacterium]